MTASIERLEIVQGLKDRLHNLVAEEERELEEVRKKYRRLKEALHVVLADYTGLDETALLRDAAAEASSSDVPPNGVVVPYERDAKAQGADVLDERDAKAYGLLSSLPSRIPLDTEPSQEVLGETEDEGEGKRQRLPRGFVRKQVMRFANQVGHFFHIQELEEAMREAIRERFPNDLHLEPSRNSMNHNLRLLWQEGKLARSVYDDHTQYFFHGLPSFVRRTAFGPVYADPSVAPLKQYLEGVSNPTPEFPEPTAAAHE